MLNSEVKNGTLVLIPEGKIDTTNVQEFRVESESIIDNNPGLPIVIDADDLSYISSAGLRVILSFLKRRLNVSVINANSTVYEIFESTGFSEMMDVKKAYKKISIEGCEIIGRGSNGTVYRTDPETIVKVYNNPDSLPEIQNERRLARYAFVHGIPTAISYDIVRVGETYGSVFELLNATSLSKMIVRDPDHLKEYVGEFVDLLKTIHEQESSPGDVPSVKETYLGYARFLKEYLPEKSFSKLLDLISAVPENCHLIHGDYYANNVMFQDGNPVLIDMDTLSCGDPVFEFASTYNALGGFASIYEGEDACGRLSGKLAMDMWDETMKLYYSGLSDEERQTQNDRVKLLGYARILRRHIKRIGMDTEIDRSHYEKCRNFLVDLIDKVDTLV
ncbi:MAG: phosphotransferase [Eubacteriales bacterium]|nr:phosphotransferase [Eubacteriales bacterium]